MTAVPQVGTSLSRREDHLLQRKSGGFDNSRQTLRSLAWKRWADFESGREEARKGPTHDFKDG